MTLDYHDQNTKEFWNDLLVNAAVINDLTLAKYCLNQGATNLAECFYCAKNYKNDELANYFVGAVNRNKENIDINSLYDNKQHALIYEYFS